MGDTSNIAWTKSTFNPWIGCTKVGPGCDGCYAETLDNRHRWGGATHWGAGVPRHRTSVANWRKPLAWNLQAPTSEFAGRKGFWPVFCASLADVFDNEVPFAWRMDLFLLIHRTPNLSWLLVTKRIGNVKEIIRQCGEIPPNVRLMITVVNQEEADRDIPKLLALPCKNGISYEPALGPIDFTRIDVDTGDTFLNALTGARPAWNSLDWVIVGGESSQGKHKARLHNIEWDRAAIEQCKAAGVPVFEKQLGSNPVCMLNDGAPLPHQRLTLKDRAGADPTEWPEDLRVQEFPE